jgi:NAD(P)-dependent dehydrogenase (short-subunit alcohol dehydrogenase family)
MIYSKGMDMQPGNRTAVITGATGVLGSTLTHALAERRYNLALLDRNLDRLNTLVESLHLPDHRVRAQKINLVDVNETQAAADAIESIFGKIDVLIHLIGGWTGGKTLTEAPAEDLELMLNQHVWASFYITKAFVPLLIQNGWGRVIMITSPLAARPVGKSGPYAIGKAGQKALVMTLSQELKGTGVTANLLQVKTIDVKREKVSAPSTENASWSTPEEITASILFLLSDDAGTINGARIPLTGSY